MCLKKNIKNALCSLCAALFVLYSSFIFTACATPEEVGKVQYDLLKLKSEIKKMKRKSLSLEAQLPSRKGQFNEKLHRLEKRQKATAGSVSDLLIKVQNLSTDVQNITGRLEETRYFSEKNSKELTENRKILVAQVKKLELAVNDSKKKLAQLEQSLALIEKKTQELIKEAKKEEPKEKAVKSKAKNVYMAGYEAFRAGKTGEAREKFTSLLEDFPENEYSDNARFWIAEIYYKDENYEDAILAYEELFRKNPNSNKIPGAMLKQGLAFYELKDKKTGQLILERLIDKFPDSKASELAREKLKESTSVKEKR